MKLYRFRQSSYARKIQLLLELLGVEYTTVDVPYCDRAELAAVTGGYIYVPVLVDDDGTVVVESRRIAERLLARPGGAALVPSPWEGPIWAYCDWVDGPLEDVLFRLAAPKVRDSFRKLEERSLYVLIKERKFGAGCVDAWDAARAELIERGAEVSEVSHRLGPGKPTLKGRDPERHSYASFATFSDPDGNTWLLQEITARLPGRVDTDEATYTSQGELSTALQRAAAAHGEHEKRTGQPDANWPEWYSKYMLAEQTGKPLPT